MRSPTLFEKGIAAAAVVSLPLVAACSPSQEVSDPDRTTPPATSSAAPEKLGSAVCDSLVGAVHDYGWPDRTSIIFFFGDGQNIFGGTIAPDLEESGFATYQSMRESDSGLPEGRADAATVAENGIKIAKSIGIVLKDKTLPQIPVGETTIPDVDASPEYREAEKLADKTQALAVETVEAHCIPADVDSY